MFDRKFKKLLVEATAQLNASTQTMRGARYAMMRGLLVIQAQRQSLRELSGLVSLYRRMLISALQGRSSDEQTVSEVSNIADAALLQAKTLHETPAPFDPDEYGINIAAGTAQASDQCAASAPIESTPAAGSDFSAELRGIISFLTEMQRVTANVAACNVNDPEVQSPERMSRVLSSIFWIAQASSLFNRIVGEIYREKTYREDVQGLITRCSTLMALFEEKDSSLDSYKASVPGSLELSVDQLHIGPDVDRILVVLESIRTKATALQENLPAR